jgi:hypothetical protein
MICATEPVDSAKFFAKKVRAWIAAVGGKTAFIETD